MIDIFIAYSHEDYALKNELKKFLRPLSRENRISLWDDFDIEAGEEWDAKIKERLYGADIVLLLVSSDSLASDYFYGKEVAISLERHKKSEAIVTPIILRHCDWINTPIGELEAIPEKGRPIVEWLTRDQAWQDIVSRLRRVVDIIEIKKKNEEIEAGTYKRFNAAIQAANHLIDKSNWVEAETVLLEALSLYKKTFEPNDVVILGKINECKEAQNKQEEKRKRLGKEWKRKEDALRSKQANKEEAEKREKEKNRLEQENNVIVPESFRFEQLKINVTLKNTTIPLVNFIILRLDDPQKYKIARIDDNEYWIKEKLQQTAQNVLASGVHFTVSQARYYL